MSVIDNARAALDALGIESGPLRALIAEYERVTGELRDIADHGLRFDLNPTLMFTTAGDVYTQWAVYAQRMDKSVRERAAAALRDGVMGVPNNARADAGVRRRGPITDEMVAAALDARAFMPSKHCYLYATERCLCGEEWSDAHRMRFILEAALGVA